MKSSNNIVIRLLMSSQWRIFRHFILFVFILSISASFVNYEPDLAASVSPLLKYGGMFFYAFLFLATSYFNIYILTPKLLLKNKWGFYFCALSGLVVLMLIAILLFQNFTFYVDGIEEDKYYGNIHYLTGIINLISGSQVFFLIFAGTSTVVVFKHWILDVQQSEELKSTTLQMELKLLENQINPHFLFNMLNNANIMIKKDPDVAIHIIGKLEEMLDYLMNESVQNKVFLNDEVLFLSDYLELEKTRRDYFNYTVSKDGDLDNIQIAPLLFITFVENAVKHNQDSRSASYVHILFKIIEDTLIFTCVNSIPQKISHTKQVGGIGLNNIKRRLDLLYDGNYSLEQTKTNITYTVNLKLKL